MKKLSLTLYLAAAWTIFVWVTRVGILFGPASGTFKLVHGVLVLGSLTAGVATLVVARKVSKL